MVFFVFLGRLNLMLSREDSKGDMSNIQYGKLLDALLSHYPFQKQKKQKKKIKAS